MHAQARDDQPQPMVARYSRPVGVTSQWGARRVARVMRFATGRQPLMDLLLQRWQRHGPSRLYSLSDMVFLWPFHWRPPGLDGGHVQLAPVHHRTPVQSETPLHQVNVVQGPMPAEGLLRLVEVPQWYIRQTRSDIQRLLAAES